MNENYVENCKQKQKTAINRLCDENFALLDSYWVKRDNNIEAVAHYKYFKARQYHDKAYTASGEDKEKETSSALQIY